MSHALREQMVESLKRHLAGGKPAVPEAGVLLWNLFMEIAASRTYHAAGPNPISYQEIVGFSHINRWPLQAHHVAILRSMDDAWLEHAYRKVESGRGGHDSHTFDSARYANAPLLTAEAFDAVF